MAQELAPLDPAAHVGQVFVCGNLREYRSLQELFAPDAALDLTRQGLGTYEGPEAIRSFCEGWIEVYEDFVLTAADLVAFGDVVLTVNRHSGRLRDSSAPVILDNAWVFVCHDNAIARWTAYNDVDEARAAADRLAKERG